MRRAITFCCLCLLTGVLSPGTALGETYYGPEVVGSRITRGEQAFGQDFDNLATGARFNLGYTVNPWLDIQGSLGGFGHFRGANVDVRYTGAMASVRPRLALGSQARLYGKLGVGIMHINASLDQDDTKPAGVGGIGVEVDLSRSVSFRAGLDSHTFSTRVGDDPDNTSRTTQHLQTTYFGIIIRPRAY